MREIKTLGGGKHIGLYCSVYVFASLWACAHNSEHARKALLPTVSRMLPLGWIAYSVEINLTPAARNWSGTTGFWHIVMKGQWLIQFSCESCSRLKALSFWLAYALSSTFGFPEFSYEYGGELRVLEHQREEGRLSSRSWQQRGTSLVASSCTLSWNLVFLA